MILISDEDPAALNIHGSLLAGMDWVSMEGPSGLQEPSSSGGEGHGWGPLGEMLVEGGANAWRHPHSPCAMLMMKGSKLYWEDVDVELSGAIPSAELIIFPSRHKSESGLRTLTVHPTGNYSSADFGGVPGQLSVCAPAAQTEALRHLDRKAREAGLDHAISFECTHHGPRVSTPHFFIEIGSDEEAWVEKSSGDALASAILDLVGSPDAPWSTNGRVAEAVIGVGGGHYCPRFTEVALKKKCAIGHMIPNYALDCTREALRQAVDRTPGARFVYFHRKSMKGARYRELRDWFTSPDGGGLLEVRSRDMDDL